MPFAFDLRLAVMSFPQHWDGSTLALNLLCIPSVDPLTDPVAASAPAFADHVPLVRAVAIPSLDAFPSSGDPRAVRIPATIVAPPFPQPPRPNFNALSQQATAQGVTIGPPPPAPSAPVQRIRKALPDSYLALAASAPNGVWTTTTDEFGCAIRPQKPGVITGPPKRQTSWGELISYALRQPVLAAALGLRYEVAFPVDRAAFADGGWVFVELDPADPWAQAAQATPGAIRLFAARMPALDNHSRPVFAAVLFPVDASGAPTDPSATREAETYDAGFAQIVHVHQPTRNDGVIGDASAIPAPGDIGIQIGWDDEQVVTWSNRQLALLGARRQSQLDAQTPLGVLGYRVDVADITGRDPGSVDPIPWESLMNVHGVLPAGFGTFDGELMIEPSPLRINDSTADAWLPHYFANWRGGSLSVADDVPNKLIKKPTKPGANTPLPLLTLLSYGRSYAFRVRLGDLTSGGPGTGEQPVAPGPADVATITFARMVPPKSPRVLPKPVPREPASLTILRPIIGYPEVLYTHLGDSAADRDTIVQYYLSLAAQIPQGSGDVAGVPDPDVDTLRITVLVRAPAHDVAGPGGTLDGSYRVLYATERAFPALPSGPTPTDPGLSIDIAYVDAPSVVDWAPTGWPATGPLVIPRARDVQLRLEPVVRDDPTYFGDAARQGLTTTIAVRAELRDEPALLVPDAEGDEPIRGFLFRRPPGIDAPPVVAQLAQALRLVADGLTMTAPPGLRVAFGTSRAIRHALSGDGGTLTFASESELLRNWIIAIVVDLDRDWTWDGLAGPITVERNAEIVGTLALPRTLGPQSVADPANWSRTRTRLVFFDAVDPHESTPSGFPEALRHAWTLTAATNTETGPPVGVSGAPTYRAGFLPKPPQPEIAGQALELTLPISIAPKQIPTLASVGIALSPYVVGAGYASTEQRRRALWLELTEKIDNAAGDALFARVIGHGADPLLYEAVPVADQPKPPPLVLDPELMRIVVPHDSDDRAGLDAMVQLEQATDSDIRFLLPLPPGIEPDDPELFGFWTYELRIGHAGDPHAPHQRWWSTAQARFGRPLRVNGVQHPAPPLPCRAGRVAVIFRIAEGESPPLSAELLASMRDVLGATPTAEPATGELALTTTSAALGAPTFIEATAPYATPVLNGRTLVTPFTTPKTTLCFLLYAQVVQADGSTNRNVLLAHRYDVFRTPRPSHGVITDTQRDRIGRVVFSTFEVEQLLFRLALPLNSPLSMLAVELLPGGTGIDVSAQHGAVEPRAAASARDPLGQELAPYGHPQRILRVSPLVPVAAVC